MIIHREQTRDTGREVNQKRMASLNHKLNCKCVSCRNKRGDPHKFDCKCCVCRSKQGERLRKTTLSESVSRRISSRIDQCDYDFLSECAKLFKMSKAEIVRQYITAGIEQMKNYVQYDGKSEEVTVDKTA